MNNIRNFCRNLRNEVRDVFATKKYAYFEKNEFKTRNLNFIQKFFRVTSSKDDISKFSKKVKETFGEALVSMSST